VIAESGIPSAANPLLQHALDTYASEINKTASVFGQFAMEDLPFRPHPRSSTTLEIFRHQLLSERRFFGDFLGSPEPDPSFLFPCGGYSGSIRGASGRTGAAEVGLPGESERRLVDGPASVLRCRTATNLDFLEARTAFRASSDAVNRLSAAARKASGFDLRPHRGCDLGRGFSHASVDPEKCGFSQ
jgi:hypothetical protein